MSRQGKNFEPFKKVDTWIFDLDNTLYPAHSNLFDPIDARMKMYIAAKLDIKPEQAYRIQKDLYHRYGTTLYGLMNLYGVEPKEFLDYVHNTELQHIEPNKPLSEAISGLDGKKYIFTNSRLSHAENITRQLGILQDFDGIFDIKDSHYIPKPYKASYTRFLQQFSINPQRAAMFEDL
ncbi:MAG: pyrimidine 5'-nucleotidase, partial [Alphaproteobacteria bacterium]|nr:pyrimidine 5'-nucleotidase [Alphaproteobacteria bacterium]